MADFTFDWNATRDNEIPDHAQWQHWDYWASIFLNLDDRESFKRSVDTLDADHTIPVGDWPWKPHLEVDIAHLLIRPNLSLPRSDEFQEQFESSLRSFFR